MRRLEQHGLQLIDRITTRGNGALIHEIAAVLGLSLPGAAVIVGRLDRAGYLQLAVARPHAATGLLITGLTPAGQLALRAASRPRRQPA